MSIAAFNSITSLQHYSTWSTFLLSRFLGLHELLLEVTVFASLCVKRNWNSILFDFESLGTKTAITIHDYKPVGMMITSLVACRRLLSTSEYILKQWHVDSQGSRDDLPAETRPFSLQTHHIKAGFNRIHQHNMHPTHTENLLIGLCSFSL